MILEDELHEIDWKVLSEKKKIGRFLCQKAVAQIRGRKYSAWFTHEVLVSTGPWKLYGLPGLILEAEDESGEVKFRFNSLELPANVESYIHPPKPKKNQRIILAKDFLKIRTENIEKQKKMLSAKPGVKITTSIDISPKGIEIYK